MKKIILLFIFFSIKNVFAQSEMSIFYSNGTIVHIPIANIDSMYYINISNVCPPTLTDIDGNIYNTVEIGTQCWMKENLKTKHFNNGGSILTVLNNSQWSNTTSGACSDYNNDTSNTSVYGKLYNWYAVIDPAGLCPVGWHEPKNSEWNYLIKTLDPNADTSCVSCISSLIAGGLLKETGNLHWLSPNTGATNSSGFNALPAGMRSSSNGYYSQLGNYAYFWTVTPYSNNSSFYHSFLTNSAEVRSYNLLYGTGFSVRCIKD